MAIQAPKTLFGKRKTRHVQGIADRVMGAKFRFAPGETHHEAVCQIPHKPTAKSSFTVKLSQTVDNDLDAVKGLQEARQALFDRLYASTPQPMGGSPKRVSLH